MTREEELEMTNIKCYHCKGTHANVQTVKDCSKVQIGWEVKTYAPNAKPVEVVIPATVVKKSIPAHRIAKKAVLTIPAAVETPVVHAEVGAWKKAFVANAAPIVVPAKTEVLTGQDLPLGMYQMGDEVYKVVYNKIKTYKYAHKLVIYTYSKKGKFFYAPGVINQLTSEMRMDLEGAKGYAEWTEKKFGHGFCCQCGKLLTDPKSVAAGIGPVCAGKL